MLECREVSHSFFNDEGEIPILSKLQFQFVEGETYAITGTSGSGKSTLLNILSGLLKPSQGEVYFNDQNLYQFSDQALSQWRLHSTGYIYQDFRLLPRLTAEENVAFLLQLAGEKLNTALSQARIILSELGLEKRLKHYPQKLSGGEQQRVALARAFVSKKKIIFADEPTGNLDVISAQKVMQTLLNLNEKNQTTLILVTHESAIAKLMKNQLAMTHGVLN
jgi:putative ABC transport system ATP-binding protein